MSVGSSMRRSLTSFKDSHPSGFALAKLGVVRAQKNTRGEVKGPAASPSQRHAIFARKRVVAYGREMAEAQAARDAKLKGLAFAGLVTAGVAGATAALAAAVR